MNVDEKRLIRLALEGDSEAFGALIDLYQEPIFNSALRFAGDYDDAADITQTVFLRAYEKLGTYKPQYRFFSWIYKIMINESLNHLDRQKAFEPLSATMVSGITLPDQACYESELQETIDRALMELPFHARTVIVLRHFMSFSYAEISETIGIPIKTVKSRLFDARQKLGLTLGEQGLKRR